MKDCTPLWHEAHFEVNILKTSHVRSTFGSWAVEKVHVVVVRNTFGCQNAKARRVQTTFGSWTVRKVHTIVARSNIRSQKVQGTSALEHFRRLRSSKSACDCGTKKHMSKSKRTTNAPQLRRTFSSWNVQKVHAVVAGTCRKHIWKSTCIKNNTFGPLLELEMLKKCTQLYREAHLEVKKHTTFAPILNVQVQVSFLVAGETTTTN